MIEESERSWKCVRSAEAKQQKFTTPSSRACLAVGCVVLWEAEAGGWGFLSTTLVRQSLTQELHTDTLTLDSSYPGLLKYSEVRPKDTKT